MVPKKLNSEIVAILYMNGSPRRVLNSVLRLTKGGTRPMSYGALFLINVEDR